MSIRVSLSGPAMEALTQLAERDRRLVHMEAEVLIMRMLHSLGLLELNHVPSILGDVASTDESC